MRRAAAVTTAMALACAAAAGPAGAATVTLDETPGVDAPKGMGTPGSATVSVTALPGEANRITATRGAGTALVLRDPSAPLTPGAGCATTAPGEVTCTPTVASVGLLSVDAGDGDDLVDVSSAPGTRLTVDGGPGDDTLRGGDGDDDLRPGTGRDVVDGGPGARDTVYYDERTAPVTVALDGSAPSGEAGEGDVLRGVEGVHGGAGADMLGGTDAADQLDGGPGDDAIDGRGDDDALSGGTGDDTLDGGPGDDTLSGDAGRDALFGGAGDDFLWGRGGPDLADGGAGSDRIDATGDDFSTTGERILCGDGARDRVDSPAGLEFLAPDCERIDVSVPGEDVQPLRLHGTPRVRGDRIVVRVGCDPDDCGDRSRVRLAIRATPGGRVARAAATLRAGQVRTLSMPRGRLRPDRRIRVSVSGRQIEGGDGVAIRGGFFTVLR